MPNEALVKAVDLPAILYAYNHIPTPNNSTLHLYYTESSLELQRGSVKPLQCTTDVSADTIEVHSPRRAAGHDSRRSGKQRADDDYSSGAWKAYNKGWSVS